MHTYWNDGVFGRGWVPWIGLILGVSLGLGNWGYAGGASAPGIV